MVTKPKNQLNVLYINIRSMKNKLEDIDYLLKTSDKEIHVIALTETWLYPNETSFFNIPNYVAVHDCRDTRGGSVAIYLKQNITYNQVTAPIIDHCNIVGVNLLNYKLRIFVIYRSPSSNVQQFIDAFEDLLDNQKSRCVVIGDINLDLLDGGNHVTEYKNIIEMNAFNLHNKIDSLYATRVGFHRSSIIDHVMSNKKLKCEITLKDHSISDHKLMNITVDQQVMEKVSKVVTRSYVNIADWRSRVSLELNNKTISSFGELANILCKTKTLSTKQKNIKIINNNDWITNEFIAKVKYRDRLYRMWKRLKTPHSESEFKKAKNAVTNQAKQLKIKWANREFSKTENNPKKAWNLINNLVHNKNSENSNNIKQINISDEIFTDETIISNKFNGHYATIGEKLASEIPPAYNQEYTEQESTDSIDLGLCDESEINSVIKSIKSNSAGHDGVSKWDLLNLLDIIIVTITRLVNDVLTTGQFPEELKVAKILPLHKGGLKDLIINYRPISILSIFSKIIEKIVKKRIALYVKDTFGFDKYQYGFQEASSTMSATTDLLESVSAEINKNNYVILVFVDLQKAFDTVDIEILLKKLRKMGFRGTAYKLLKTYLEHRSHYTVVNNVSSEKRNVNMGVPQGSVLGPILYLLYVQCVGTKAKYFSFADDTVLVYSSPCLKSIESTINEDLTHYSDWLRCNKLSINVKKTVYMCIKQKNKPFHDLQIRFDNNLLDCVDYHKYLGLYIDEKLSWHKHINHITSKIVPIVGALKRCAYMMSDKHKNTIYYCLVGSRLRYLINCWGNASDTLISKLQIMQNKTIKVLYNYDSRKSTAELYSETKLLNIKNLKKLEQVKLVHGMQVGYIKSNHTFMLAQDVHNHDTRNKDFLRNELRLSKKTQDSPIYRAIEAYNTIPARIKEIENKNSFNIKLKLHLKCIMLDV